MNNHALPGTLTRIALSLMEGLGSPVSKSVSAMIRAGDWDGISSVKVDPRTYTIPHSYFLDAIAGSFLRKFEPLPTSSDRVAAARAKWREGETQCYRANERLAKFLPSVAYCHLSESDEEIASFFREARELIGSWIGFKPPSLLEGRFGPGTSFSMKGGKTTVPDKMSIDPSLTRGALWFLPQWLGSQWGAGVARRRGEVSFVPGNRFATVPKTCLTHRAIAIEPDINVFYQLGLGKALRTRLRENTGWDLDRAQDIHGRVARESSVSREFATLDLSNASDTVCRHLVEVLLPPLWYEQLDGLRSPKTLLDAKWVRLEKFSSMGNGFTFELETLLFAALSVVTSRRYGHKGVLGKDVFCFGDDIICKDDVVPGLRSVLEFCGFSLNVDKSFWGQVPFRESCGQDFFNGKSVRPHFLEEDLEGPEDYIALANGIARLSEQLGELTLPAVKKAWFQTLDQLPTGIRSCRGPKGLGDIVITDEEKRWSVRQRGSIRYIRCYRPVRYRKVNVHAFGSDIILACATYGLGSTHPRGWAWHKDGGVVPRNGVLGYKVGWVAAS